MRCLLSRHTRRSGSTLWRVVGCSSVDIDTFRILASANSVSDLRILESLHSKTLNPDLYKTHSSYPLAMVKNFNYLISHFNFQMLFF